MKQRNIFLLILLMGSSLISALDWDVSGALENNFQAMGRNDISLTNKSTFKLGLEIHFSPTLSMITSGKVDYLADISDSSNNKLDGNLDNLFFRISTEQDFGPKIQVGRMNFRDNSGYILNSALNGVKGSFYLGETISFDLGAGYSGLLFSDQSSLVLTKAQSEADAFLAPQRVIWSAMGGLDEPSGLQFLIHSFGQVALDDQDIMTWYGGLNGRLPIKDFVISGQYSYNGGHSAITLEGTSFTSRVPISAHLVNASVRYYPNFLRDRGVLCELSGFYTSGDGYDVRSEPIPGSEVTGSVFMPDQTELYTPITYTSISSIFDAVPGNLTKVNLEMSGILAKGDYDRNVLKVNLGSSGYFRSVHGPVLTSGLYPMSTNSYLGTEIRGGLTLRPLLDLGLEWKSSLLLPNNSSNGPFYEVKKSIEWESQLFLSLAL